MDAPSLFLGDMKKGGTPPFSRTKERKEGTHLSGAWGFFFMLKGSGAWRLNSTWGLGLVLFQIEFKILVKF